MKRDNKHARCHSCASGELLRTAGGSALHVSAVRHSHPSQVQTERKGHHQRLAHRPLPGQRDLLPGYRSVRRRCRCQQGAPVTTWQEKIKIHPPPTLSHYFLMKYVISLSSSLPQYPYISCETSSSRSRYFLLCLCCVSVPRACYWLLHIIE